MKLQKAVAFATALVIAIGALACNRSSPTSTLRDFYTAIQKKDAEGIKKTLSKGTLEMFEGFAKEQKKTLDDALKAGLANTSDKDAEKMPETRNEKIEGDKATVEVKNDKSNSWETVPFVKEDGAWKIAFDQVFRDAVKKMGSSTNPGQTGNSGSDNKTGNSSGK